ncbi:SMI1/KNR4 family protein [Microcoleus sp. MOSTC5]|uniref:SMI1/KNR4 family protein n=1 Tax=unclassified Microcoleus TaxID=2642155 RepID=UPI002FCFCDD4
MKISKNIKELAELLQPLQQEDKNLHGTRADSHQYKLRQTLAEAELQSFERQHQIKLPEDYRTQFISLKLQNSPLSLS